MFQQAQCAVPGQILGHVDDDDVEQGNGDQVQPTGPAEETMAWKSPSESASDRPSGQKAGREDEQDEDEAGQPGDLSGGKLDLE